MVWTIDAAHTTVGFTARHLGLSKVRGQFTRFGGEVEGDPRDISGARGRFVVEMDSIDTGNADRDAHLRSADFFDVENHPEMVFESSGLRRSGDHYEVEGQLTIKGITKPVKLTYEHGGETADPYGNRKIGGTLSGTIKRSEWGLTWNVPLESGGWLVSDKINLDIDLQVAERTEELVQEAKAEAEITA